MNQPLIIIQARMGSTRFPGKVLAIFLGKPMLQFQVELLKQYGFGGSLVVATSIEKKDDAIEDLCKYLGVDIYRGNEENVYSRFKAIAFANPNTTIVRLTADNPLPNKKLLKEVLAFHYSEKSIFTSSRLIEKNKIIKRTLPKGYSVDVFQSSIFELIEDATLSDFDKEHVIPPFYQITKVNLYEDDRFANEQPITIDTQIELTQVEQKVKELIRNNMLNHFLGLEN